MNRIRKITPTHLWLVFFGLWGVILTGALADFVGSPGVIQAMRLQQLLRSKQDRATQIEKQIARLEGERGRLESNRVEQERQIRKTLGYAAPDEIIFDFTPMDRFTASLE